MRPPIHQSKVADASGWSYPIGEHDGGPDLYEYLRRLRATQLPAELREEARRLYTDQSERGAVWHADVATLLRRIAAIGEEG